MTPTAASGSRFAGWSAASCSGTGGCQVTLDSDAAVMATFEVLPTAPLELLPPAAPFKPSAPALSHVKLDSKHLAAKKALALKLTISQPATIRVLIAQTVKGHKLRGVCKPAAKKGKSCTTAVDKRTLTFSGSAGSNTLELKLAGLGNGSYIATITADNANGQSSTVELAFTVTHREAKHAATMRGGG